MKNYYSGGRKRATRNGYTLVELIVVVMLIMVLTAAALAGIIRSQRVFRFNAADQQVGAMVREARSLAVTGKAVIDYDDYDNDGCRNAGSHDPGCGLGAAQDDYVTPAHYGVHFDTTNNMLIVFADMHDSATVGGYDNSGDFLEYIPGRDMRIAEYEVDPALDLLVEGSTGTAANTVMYSPLYADTMFSDDTTGVDLTGEFFVFGIRENEGTILRENCLAIHPIAGVPETTDATGAACP